MCLWHAVLFYTTGAIVARELGGGYVPYATKTGLWERGFSQEVEGTRVAEEARALSRTSLLVLDSALKVTT